MATTSPLQINAINAHLIAPPLLRIKNVTFTHWYAIGINWRLDTIKREIAEAPGPLPDDYLLHQFKEWMQSQYFDARHEEQVLTSVSFALGMLHGAVLLPDGTLCKEATTLVRLHDEQIARGYRVGREYFFTEAETDEEWTITDTYLIDQLYKLAEEYHLYQEPEQTVRYHLGCLLGRMSGHLFSWTREEQSVYEQECIRILGYPEELRPNCIAARQFVVSTVV